VNILFPHLGCSEGMRGETSIKTMAVFPGGAGEAPQLRNKLLISHVNLDVEI
jgi:hypothetical protein